MTPRRLRAVLFDLDDTLHDDTATYHAAARAVATDVAQEHDVPVEPLVAAYVCQAERFWQSLDASALGTSLVELRARMWHAALSEAGLDDAALAGRCGVAYDAWRRRLLRPWPGSLALLESLRRAGLKLAMITNGFAETHREKIALLQLERAFDAILIADEVGMVKPDPRFFRLAAARLQVDPAACAMVGDRFERDIRGAAAVGMFTVWLNARGETMPSDLTADAVVASILEVEGVLPLSQNVVRS